MTPERWATIEKLYHEALAQDTADRGRFLADACAGDEALRRDVRSLLEHDGSAAFLSTPAVVQVGHVIPTDSSLIGKAIGPYAISARIGAGGMGEVYRARDQKLGRDVAIKILSKDFTSDPERLARFAREARVLATLNHPHIGAIYGWEEFGGVGALILELVEGETLAERLEHGSIPVRESLTMARQIADALEASHEKDIVHRDLKPANIKINERGLVKVLDFGLAKAASRDMSAPDVSHSPTIRVTATREGMLLGTAAYMSPEQARGQAVDKQADIWAFGCVLYEMLTGRVAFAGPTVTDTLGAILERDPDWTKLPSATSAAVRRLLRRCLEKDCRVRLHDIADARLELDDAALPGPTDPGPSNQVRLALERVGRHRFHARGGHRTGRVGALARPAARHRRPPASSPDQPARRRPLWSRRRRLRPPGSSARFVSRRPDSGLRGNGQRSICALAAITR